MRYHFYNHGDKTICTSTYAGKTVRAETKIRGDDKYDEAKGALIARTKVDVKVAKKRVARATKKVAEAKRAVAEAVAHQNRMERYLDDAYLELNSASEDLRELIR